jgi:ribosomal protein L11 methyltransferase
MNWLEVSVTTDGELAEAIADVLARFAPNGVTTEQAVRFTNGEDAGTPCGPITVRAYLPDDEKIDSRQKSLEEALHYLGMIKPIPAPVFTKVADQNWMEAWKERYHPIPVGRHLIIVPAWLDSPDPARIAIKIDPGMAFGTGTHPTTQLCLEFIEELYSEINAKMRAGGVIDIGCGSGILSIAALKLGAALAIGVDIDEAAIRASHENARANSIEEEAFILGIGSVEEVLAGKYPIQSAPLVLANILAPILVRLFDGGLADLVAPGGGIILSGILADQAETVKNSAEAHELTYAGEKHMEDWVTLLFERN